MIRVRFFAALRERIGCASLDIDAAASSDLCGVIESVRHRFGDDAAEALLAPNVRIAVNREFVGRRAAVSDGDEVAFMPPITGG